MENIVDYLSKILKSLDKIEESKSDKAIEILQEKDTRKTFFKMLASSLRVYYLAFNNIFIVNKIDKNSIKLIPPEEGEKIHVENAGWLLGEKYLKDSYITVLKMNLINDCWVCFESTLRDIFYVKEPTKYKNNIWEIYTNKIFDSKNINVTKDNKKFLGFLGHCRNAMHNNSIHNPSYVKNKDNWEYTLNGKNYKLEEDKKIEFMTNDVILEIIKKLSDVALNMYANSLSKYPDFIPDMYNSR